RSAPSPGPIAIASTQIRGDPSIQRSGPLGSGQIRGNPRSRRTHARRISQVRSWKARRAWSRKCSSGQYGAYLVHIPSILSRTGAYSGSFKQNEYIESGAGPGVKKGLL